MHAILSFLFVLFRLWREWVSSFFTAHQHILGYLEPENNVKDVIKDEAIIKDT